MASYSYPAPLAWACPSEHDLNGGVAGKGRVLQEPTFGQLLKGIGGLGNFVVSGFALPASGSATGQLLTGVAVIDGRHIGTVAPGITVNFPFATNWVFLRLTYGVDEKATGISVECHEDWDVVQNSILLGIVTTGAGLITGMTDGRSTGKLFWGCVLLNGSAPNCRIANCGSNNWTPSKSGNNLIITFNAPLLVPYAFMYGYPETMPYQPAVGSATITDAFDHAYQFFVIIG